MCEFVYFIEVWSVVATARRDVRDGVGATGVREFGMVMMVKENGW